MKFSDIAIIALIAIAAGFWAWTYRDKKALMELEKQKAAAKIAYDSMAAADKAAYDQMAARAQSYFDKLPTQTIPVVMQVQASDPQRVAS